MFDISKCYGAFCPDRDKAYFWSGLGRNGQSIAEEIAKENGGTTLEMLMAEHKADLIKAGFEYDSSIDRFVFSPENIDDWRAISSAFAEQASGEVHVVLGDYVREDSVWKTSEFPALSDNSNITRVIAVDPTTGHDKDVLLDKTNSVANSDAQRSITSSNISSFGGGGARAPNHPEVGEMSLSDIPQPRKPVPVGEPVGAGATKADLPPIASPQNSNDSFVGPPQKADISPEATVIPKKVSANPIDSSAAESAQNAMKGVTGGIV